MIDEVSAIPFGMYGLLFDSSPAAHYRCAVLV